MISTIDGDGNRVQISAGRVRVICKCPVSIAALNVELGERLACEFRDLSVGEREELLAAVEECGDVAVSVERFISRG